MQSSYILGLTRHVAANSRGNIFQPSLSNKLYHAKPLSSSPCLRWNVSQSRRQISVDIYPRPPARNTRSLLYKAAGVAGVGIGVSLFAAPTVFCEPAVARASPTTLSQPSGAAPFQSAEAAPPPPSSNVHYLELTFGTVTGICAGVFVKKGAKAVAFVLGGVFVLLQYLGSLSLVRVDWSRASTRFENLFYTKDAAGRTKAPNVGSFFRWVIDFLTSDFQQRASFVAGFALGLRIG
ncbi:hypothetical protein POSPLADRAFT_1038908 [Postia placenta MAD-698-R-SB12]|uniref:FUN14 domain-containing protein n=1 Tax=Postia placenta MAD-698-R-SB12 TaxID=670580 RepID=A0A1X6N8T4_9APHY|nr:hypothetical protein POSPLADRAFT_1038908 [Postia placenta MAD-698-R-SB12]OSX65045.1 hypothetical protein POSPLADRAFT_1038908 [Postia placenta MAD-698-R-SB12]